MSLTNSFNTRYLVGIDLGTTNCAVCFIDTKNKSYDCQVFRIPQLGKYGEEVCLSLLPSFLYLNEPEGIVVGTFAKMQGAEFPHQVIHAAKSWLSNPAAFRKEKILPFDCPDPNRRISPVEASYLILEHIKKMWNQQMAKKDPDSELEEQEIVLTVPASFDEVARSLTVEAASLAGFKHLTLLEEPQAAFYCYLMEKNSQQFRPGDTILVCDVGGGTTDFSLIDIVEETNGIEMRRMAVGKHLLLGGDNMDEALVHLLKQRMGGELTNSQHLSLLHQIRNAKESLACKNDQESYPIQILGKGSSVVAGSLSYELQAKEVLDCLLEGFFGLFSFEEALKLKKSSGIRQMGLCFEVEPSITKHLAHFLFKCGCKKKPNFVLFNGGAMKPKAFQERILLSLNLWFKEEKPLGVLETSSLDLAVAKGAVYFAKARSSGEKTITGGIPRSFYLEVPVENEKRALTLLPRGSDEGRSLLSEETFFLMPNQAVYFQLYFSHTRLHDNIGELVLIDEEEMTPLAPLYTYCKYGKADQKEPLVVQLKIHLTAVGTLELWLLSKQGNHKWKLEFQTREEKQKKLFYEETLESTFLQEAQKEIQAAFAIGSPSKLNSLVSDLEKIFGKEKRLWSLGVLRSLFEALIAQAEKRHLSHHYESRFWNLAGFFLRPAIGHPLDEVNVKQLWKLILADFKKTKSEEVSLQQWICFRRIAAGLSKGQQIHVFNELLSCKAKKKGYAYAEHLRALASLELIDVAAKIKLGSKLAEKIVAGEGEPCDFWALGRVGARQMFYGSAANVVPPKICGEWIETVLKIPQNPHLPFTLAMLARKTGFREIDLPEALLEKIAPHLADEKDLLFQERELTLQENERFFGDSLPCGLILSAFR